VGVSAYGRMGVNAGNERMPGGYARISGTEE
jgi:hypothetical protein